MNFNRFEKKSRERRKEDRKTEQTERDRERREGGGIPTHFCLEKLGFGALLCGILTPLTKVCVCVCVIEREREREGAKC